MLALACGGRVDTLILPAPIKTMMSFYSPLSGEESYLLKLIAKHGFDIIGTIISNMQIVHADVLDLKFQAQYQLLMTEVHAVDINVAAYFTHIREMTPGKSYQCDRLNSLSDPKLLIETTSDVPGFTVFTERDGKSVAEQFASKLNAAEAEALDAAMPTLATIPPEKQTEALTLFLHLAKETGITSDPSSAPGK